MLKTLWYVDAEDAVETGEINMFVGDDFVVTVRHGEGSSSTTRGSPSRAAENVLPHGPSAVVYAVCDAIVDRYEEVAGELEIDVDEVEDVGLLPRAHQRLGAHLHPQARDRGGTPRRAAAARADAPVRVGARCAGSTPTRRRSSATSPTT